MHLETLLQDIKDVEISGTITNTKVENIQYDSRKVTPGSLFVCIEGYKTDGHNFICDAAARGAVAVAVNKDVEVEGNVIKIKHPNTRKLLAEISSKFYMEPTKKLNLIGVTGTKGKTTTTFMIRSILQEAGHKVGLIGTIANYIGDRVIPADRTTPESLELQQMFSDMLEQGVDTVVMEVSSHSLDLYRVHACDFDIGVFTNLSQDHLDFHQNFENYFRAKAKLFDMCKVGITNADDQYGRRLTNRDTCIFKTFGIESQADLRAHDILICPQGTYFKISVDKNLLSVGVPIPGKFSVYNALAAISVCLEYGARPECIIKELGELKVPGRAEIVETDGHYTIMVDYAHSPGSLENILQAVRTYARGRVVVIFGCGGDRDRTKRPIMGEIAGKLADFTIITSDNPRSEDPEAIVREIEEGIKRTRGEYIIISDRRSAIEYAVNNARDMDIILIAGKGHETYQIFGDKTIHFDDREVAMEAVESTKN